MQLSPGEFDSGNALIHARLDFLSAVDRVSPNARKVLHKRCDMLLDFNQYAQWDILGYLHNPAYAKATGLWKSDFDLLLTRIDEWQKQFCLTDSWMFDVALYTIMDGPGWRTPPYKPISYTGEGDFHYAFDLARETEAQVVNRLVNAFEHQLRNEIASARETAINQGAIPTVTKRKRTVEEIEDEQDEFTHFEWLARHVVNDESYIKIGMRYGKTDGAVKKAVQRTAKMIQLSLSSKKN